MPSQFRFFGSAADSGSAVPETLTSIPIDANSDGTRPAVTAQTAIEVPEPATRPPEPPDERTVASGLHEVIKSTDFWFNYELSLLEKNAITSAVQWAQAGIPRQDAPLEGELPIETTLKARAFEIYQEWIARIRRKVQDSIQAASADAGSRVVQLRHAIAQAERTSVEIETTEEKIIDREDALRTQQKTFCSHSLLNRYFYWVMLASIALIDWVANVPIFNELLPQEPGSRLIWRKLVADTAQFGARGGLYRIWDRILFQLDVTIFALGVVVFLLALAHFGGEALRRFVVFRPEEEPLLATSLISQRRQAKIPIVISIIGIVLAISFLYFSRDRLVESTQAGRIQAEKQVQELKDKASNIRAGRGDLNELPGIEQSLESANKVLQDWQEREHFANDISMMNRPILLLNIVLVLTAFTASYCAAEPKIVEGRLHDPLISELKSKVASLRMEMVNHRQVLRSLDTEIQTFIAQAKYLASTTPLSDWDAKARRLSAVIALFRAENARARGVDPESIVAFRQPATLDLPEVPGEPFQLPVELAASEEEFKNLRHATADHNLNKILNPMGVAA